MLGPQRYGKGTVTKKYTLLDTKKCGKKAAKILTKKLLFEFLDAFSKQC
jgi:hypothetical protein